MGGMSADVQFEVLSTRGSVRETEKEGVRGRDRERKEKREDLSDMSNQNSIQTPAQLGSLKLFHLRFLQFVADLADNLRSFVSFLLFFSGREKYRLYCVASGCDNRSTPLAF